MGVEYSPSTLRRIGGIRKRQERHWASMSGVVVSRSIFDDADEVAKAIEAVASIHGTFGLESLVTRLHACGSVLSSSHVRALLRSWTDRRGPWAKATPPLCVVLVEPDTYRVEPWAGTAYGVIQAVNTFEHHERTVRGAERAERNMLRTVTGDFGDVDRTSWRQLTTVLAP